MGVLHDYECKQHGLFESRGPHCPDCGEKCEIVYRSAPSVGHDKRRFVDGLVNQLLTEMHMTDTPKQRDYREKTQEVTRVRSNKDTPQTQFGAMKVPDMSSLAQASKPANDALRGITGHRRGQNRVPISVAVRDK